MTVQIESMTAFNLGDQVTAKFTLFKLEQPTAEYPYTKGCLVEFYDLGRDDDIDDDKGIDRLSFPIDSNYVFIKQLMPFYDVIKLLISQNLERWIAEENQLMVDFMVEWEIGKPEIKKALGLFSKHYHAFIQGKEILQ